jgi:hypothetical protein
VCDLKCKAANRVKCKSLSEVFMTKHIRIIQATTSLEELCNPFSFPSLFFNRTGPLDPDTMYDPSTPSGYMVSSTPRRCNAPDGKITPAITASAWHVGPLSPFKRRHVKDIFLFSFAVTIMNISIYLQD